MKKLILFLMAGILFFSCADEHQHEEESAEGHDHSEGNQITYWSDKTEVFIEYDKIHLNEKTHLLIHLTDLEKAKPYTGEFSLSISEGNNKRVFNNPQKINAGIYEQDMTFDKYGNYEVSLQLSVPINESIDLGILQIVKDETHFHLSHHDEAVTEHDAEIHEDEHSHEVHSENKTTEEHVHAHSSEGEIHFLKEQQWGIEFKTEVAEFRNLSNSVQATGEITSKLNSDAIISAPFTGLILPDHNPRLPMIGDVVRSGEKMAVLTPSAQGDSEQNFAAHYIERESALKLSKIELERAQRLYKKEAISLRELQMAEAEYAEAKANFGSITAFVEKYQMKDADGKDHPDLDFVIKTPISGSIEKIYFIPGEEISVGQPVYRVIDSRKVWLKINLPVTEVGKINKPGRFSFRIHGMEKKFIVDGNCCKLISYGNLVEGNSRTVPIIYEVDNPDGQLKLGMFADVRLYTSEAKSVLSIHEDALIEDEGTYTVFVQNTAESFTKKAVTIGAKDNQYVEIKSGLSEGDRVVTKGNYQVKLASQITGIPSHGHVH